MSGGTDKEHISVTHAVYRALAHKDSKNKQRYERNIEKIEKKAIENGFEEVTSLLLLEPPMKVNIRPVLYGS